MQLWDTAHGTQVLLEVLLGEGYEQDLRSLAFAADGRRANDQEEMPYSISAASDSLDAEGELLCARRMVAVRLGEAFTRVLNSQIINSIKVTREQVENRTY